MAPGILAQLSIIILFILYWAEWFQTDLSRKKGYVLVWGALGLTSCPPLGITASSWIHPGLIVLLSGLLMALCRLRLSRAVMMLSHGLFSGTLLFLWHEYARVNTDWANPLFRSLCVMAFSGWGLLISRRISEQTAYILYGSFMLHVWITYFHREMLMPLIWGPQEFLDTVWLSLTVMLGLQRTKAFVTVWIKNGLRWKGYELIRKEE
ncbi:hypothetical protein [Laceyella putida]|uniref:Uncharacterized protein n=1 Tax=Laceyella putida TaxID=110101 RepID=A0ABW2RM42_9BACL